MNRKKLLKKSLISWLFVVVFIFSGYVTTDNSVFAKSKTGSELLKEIPAYSSSAYVTVNQNKPYFTKTDLNKKAFESYSSLDKYGRCGVAYANVCQKLMPTEKRGSIGQVKPSGWHTVKYDCVEGKYLYNRCHLIGYQLTAENANERNLITGTRYLNVDGMLPFENMVADYVRETNKHVLYRVTPIYKGTNLVATGVLMEAKSVEDKGASICFNVFCYNVQPGVSIDYATGQSKLKSGAVQKKSTTSTKSTTETVYITNSGKKYHRAGCRYLKKSKVKITKAKAKTKGYEPCKICKP